MTSALSFLKLCYALACWSFADHIHATASMVIVGGPRAEGQWILLFVGCIGSGHDIFYFGR